MEELTGEDNSPKQLGWKEDGRLEIVPYRTNMQMLAMDKENEEMEMERANEEITKTKKKVK